MPRPPSPPIPPPQRGGVFVGRAHDLRALAARFAAGERWIALVGPAGIGKSRLAAEFVRARAAADPTPAWYCELAEVADVRALAARVAEAVQPDAAPPDDAWVDALGARLAAAGPGLLVLDDIDPLPRAELARVVARWLRLAPALRVLTTSRALVHDAGAAYAHELAPLAVAGDERDEGRGGEASGAAAAAVELLRDRVARARGVLSDHDDAALGAIARRLDGLPLALELVAPRVATLGAAAVLARLEQRASVLGRGALALERAFDASWEQLAPAARAALAQCAVFRGGFTLEAAEAVLDVSPAEPAIDLVQALRDRSLLTARAARGVVRFGMLLVLEQHVRARAPEGAATVAARHAAHYLARARDARGDEADDARLRDERENIGAAVAWALRNGREADAVRALVAVAGLWAAYGAQTPEGALLDAALDGPAGAAIDPLLRARACVARAGLRRHAGRPADALRDADEAAALARAARDAGVEGDALRARGAALGQAGARLEALSALQAAWACHARDADPARQVATLLALAHGLRNAGRLAEARARATEARERAARAGVGEGAALVALAMFCLESGHQRDAEAYARRGADAHRARGDARWAAVCETLAGAARQDAADLAGAEEAYRPALRALRAAGDQRFGSICEGYLGTVALERGRADEALGPLRAAAATAGAFGDSQLEALWLGYAAVAEASLGRLDEAAALVRVAAERAARVEPLEAARALEIHRALVERYAQPGDASAHAPVAPAVARAAEVPAGETAVAFFDVRLSLRLWTRAFGAVGLGAGDEAPRDAGGEPGEGRDAGAHEPRGAGAWALRVGRGGAWFQLPGHARVDLSRRVALRRVLEALVAHRLAERAESPSLGWDALLAAGWPGERIGAEAGQGRIYVAMSTLRRLGLGRALVTDGGGYRIDRAVSVVLAD